MTAYDEYDSSSGSLLAFVCGAIVGASAALLFAPMRGDEMRSSLGDAARQSRERLRQYGETGREWANEGINRASDLGRSAMNRATDAVDEAVDRTQSALGQSAPRAQDAAERARSATNRGIETARSTAKDVSEEAPDALDRKREQWS